MRTDFSTLPETMRGCTGSVVRATLVISAQCARRRAAALGGNLLSFVAGVGLVGSGLRRLLIVHRVINLLLLLLHRGQRLGAFDHAECLLVGDDLALVEAAVELVDQPVAHV